MHGASGTEQSPPSSCNTSPWPSASYPSSIRAGPRVAWHVSCSVLEPEESEGKWRAAGFHFKLEWLLRCVNSLVTGEALFDALEYVRANQVHDGLMQVEKHIDYLLTLISSRLGLDHDRVLGSRYSIPLLVRYLQERGGSLADYRERDRILYWYIHTFLWGRYSGQTETTLNQDLRAIEDIEGGLDRLVANLRLDRGQLRLVSEDFAGWNRGSRFYPMLYMLTRVHHAKDWDTGVELSNHMLGYLSRLELHHIFPKSVLYEHGYERSLLDSRDIKH